MFTDGTHSPIRTTRGSAVHGHNRLVAITNKQNMSLFARHATNSIPPRLQRTRASNDVNKLEWRMRSADPDAATWR